MSLLRRVDCQIIEKNLISIAEKSMPARKSQKVLQHLEVCQSCALLVQNFAQAWESLAEKETIAASPEFFAGVLERIEASGQPRTGAKDVFFAARRILRPAALAALLSAGIYAGYEMGNISEPSGGKVIAAGVLETSPAEFFASPYFDGFEDFPKGSIADFYLGREEREPDEKKEEGR